MNLFQGALRAETRKAWSSAMPWAVGGASLLFPLVGSLFMVIVRDPEGAKALGLLGTKARLSGLTADWPSFVSLTLQSLAVGFFFLSALFTAWIFGREWSDGTLKLLLAVPARRTRVVMAKFLVTGAGGVCTLMVMAGGALLVGTALSLPGSSPTILATGGLVFAEVGLLTLTFCPWVAFFAGLGKGFLVPLAWTLFTVAVANVTAVLGLGAWFPWSVPALLAGAGNSASPGPESIFLVLLTGAAGIAATVLFWKWADHPK